MSAEVRREFQQLREQQDAAYQEARDSLRWKVNEGRLANGLGKYRVHIPYFDLGGQLSLAYLRIERNNEVLYLKHVNDRDFASFFEGTADVGWKGITTMSTRHRDSSRDFPQITSKFFSAILEVDLYSSDTGVLSVDRRHITLNHQFTSAMGDLSERVSEIYDELINENLDSDFGLLNHKLVEGPAKTEKLKWLEGVKDPKNPDRTIAVWDNISFPVVHYPTSYSSILNEEGNFLRDFDLGQYRWCGHQLSLFYDLSMARRSSVNWRTPKMLPERIVEFTYKAKLFLGAVWTKKSVHKIHPASLLTIGQRCLFPKGWGNLMAAQIGGSHFEKLTLVNTHNSVAQAFCEERYEELLSELSAVFDPTPMQDVILKDRLYAATWLLSFFTKSSHEYDGWIHESLWNGLTQNSPSFLPSIWEILDLVKSSQATSLYVWYGERQDGYLLEVSPGVWNVHKNTDVIRQHLPEPSSEWQLQQTL